MYRLLLRPLTPGRGIAVDQVALQGRLKLIATVAESRPETDDRRVRSVGIHRGTEPKQRTEDYSRAGLWLWGAHLWWN